MEKTCRACNKSVMEPRCYYHAKRFCYTAEDCPHWRERETPLLVDALAKVTRALMVELSHARERDPDRICDEDCLEWARIVLARYQEEVGDEEG